MPMVLVAGAPAREAMRVADVEPVAGAIAGAAKAGPIDEGFGQQHRVAKAGAPVAAEPAQVGGQDAGGEVGGLTPRQDQKTDVVDHPRDRKSTRLNSSH